MPIRCSGKTAEELPTCPYATWDWIERTAVTGARYRPSARQPPSAPVAGDERPGLGRSPGRGLVQRDRPAVGAPELQHRVDDPPRAADLVGADEERGVADERVEDDPLVGVDRLLLEALVGEVHRRLLHPEGVAGNLGAEAQREPLVRLHPDDQGVGLQVLVGAREQRQLRRAGETAGHLAG